MGGAYLPRRRTDHHTQYVSRKREAWRNEIVVWDSDIIAVHKELEDKGVKVSEIEDDLHGPGTGVKWFSLNDPDGNQVILEQV